MPITAKQLAALADSFDYDGYRAQLLAAVQPHYTAIATEQGQRTADDYDLEWDAEDAFVQRWFTEYLGERITQLTESTRDMVREVLQSTLADDPAQSVQEFAGRIRDVDPYAFSPARSLTIARTETGFAVGHGAGLAYRQNGIDKVVISDGDGDAACDAADGQVWTVDRYLANALAHPNCVRSAAPADADDEVDDDEADDDEE